MAALARTVEPRKSRSSQACSRCRLHKVKCDGAAPCARCKKKKEICNFDSSRDSLSAIDLSAADQHDPSSTKFPTPWRRMSASSVQDGILQTAGTTLSELTSQGQRPASVQTAESQVPVTYDIPAWSSLTDQSLLGAEQSANIGPSSNEWWNVDQPMPLQVELSLNNETGGPSTLWNNEVCTQ